MHIPTHCCPLLLNHPDHVPSLVPILVMLLNCVRRGPLGFGLRRSRRNCASKTCRVKLFGEIFMQLLRRQWFPSAGVKLWLKFLRRDGFHRRGHAMLVQHCCRRLQLKVHHQLGEKLPGWTTALPALRPHVVDRSRRFPPRHASSASCRGEVAVARRGDAGGRGFSFLGGSPCDMSPVVLRKPRTDVCSARPRAEPGRNSG